MENEEPVLLLAKDCLLTGQEQACTRITRMFVWLVDAMLKMALDTECGF